MVDKLANALSLTGNGLRDWLVQRITSLILAAYIIFLLGFFVCHPYLEYYSWENLFTDPWMRVFSILFLLSLVWHAWIGMWTVATDYLKPAAIRFSVMVLIIIALIAYFIWGVQILWGI